MGSLDLPDKPDEPPRPEQARERGADRPPLSPRDLPDPDERARLYEATRACVSGETEKDAFPDRRPDGTDRRSYREEVPRYLDAWADHEKRWPTRPRTAPDRASDPPGSTEAIARAQEAEPKFSADAQAIEQENKEMYGGWLDGLEHRLKGEDRLKEKIGDKLKAEPRMTATEALREIGDAIRYTFCFQPDTYTRGYYDIKARYEGRGYEMYYSQNWWTNPEYKGINTRWVASEGQRFEVQFHTPDSFHAKHDVTHEAYERLRDPATRRAERRELHAFQRQVCELIEIPDGATGIPNYKKEGF